MDRISRRVGRPAGRTGDAAPHLDRRSAAGGARPASARERVRLLHARPWRASVTRVGGGHRGASLADVTAAWERFWFAPEPASTLALLRIAIGLVTLIWALALIPDLQTFEGSRGLVRGSSAAPVAEACLLGAALGLVLGYR